MLPILRIISVGGVSLAIAILILALIPPGGSHLVLAQHEVVARGVLMDPSKHPEWRQFLIHAALRRADELERLRGLSDTIIRVPVAESPRLARRVDIPIEPAMPKIAGLSALDHGTEAEDRTGSIGDNPDATLPIDIGEASSTELPINAVEDGPPAIRLPDLQSPAENNLPAPPSLPAATVVTTKKPAASRRLVQQRSRRKAAPPASEPVVVPPPFNILVAIFGSFAKADAGSQTSSPATPASGPAPRYKQASGNRAVIR